MKYLQIKKVNLAALVEGNPKPLIFNNSYTKA